MNCLSYEWQGLSSLVAELSRPLTLVSVHFDSHGWPMSITLWHTDGPGMKVQSDMHDVAERTEVGILCFSHVSDPPIDETIVDVNSTFTKHVSVSKLIIHESGTRAESGIVLRAHDSLGEIVIVPSSRPYFLAIKGVSSSMPHMFEPEYPLDRYEHVPLA